MSNEGNNWSPLKILGLFYAITIGVLILFKDSIKRWWEN